MKTSIAVIVLILLVFSESSHAQTWTEMNASKTESLKWFNEAKFGMFIHWGLYSIPAGEWNGKRIEEYRPPHVAEWIQHAAEIPRDEYRELMNQFNPLGFDAREEEGFTTKFTQEDIWFTSRGDKVYAMALELPKKNELLIRSFAGLEVKQVSLSGYEKALKWEATSEGLFVKLPGKAIGELGYALEITL